MRILLVEDNPSLAEWVTRTLRRNKFAVDCAYNGADADHLLRTQTYELVILDLSLPRLDGHEVLKRLRARDNNVPVLILTANNTVEGRILGLNEGADDYMAKPFDVNQKKNPLLQCGALRYDSNTRIFALGDKDLALPPREHAVLEALIVKLGKTVSKQSLAESLFAMHDNAGPDAIEIYVSRLRRKLEHSDAAIITLRGLGYLLKQRHAA
jgi:two-component system response regulator TctD